MWWVAAGCGKDDPAVKTNDDPAETKSSKADAADAKDRGDTEQAPAEALPEAKLIEPLGGKGPSSTATVELPPSPTFASSSVPDKYSDGAYSIAGLREDLDARVAEGDAGTEVEVRAWVAKIYVPPECPEGEVCPPAKQPHVFVTDTEDDKGLKRALMVVNYAFAIPEWDAKRWKGEEGVVLELGRQYTFKGKVKQFSDTGFAYDRGLLEFVAYRPLDPVTLVEQSRWVYPPGAPWHPLEIARQEEENAALAAKAAASAAVPIVPAE